jgi:Asp-tRNA(Asn)/Glu-tRNA(Gln) amidotransferase A subunit family amidase
MSLMDLSATDLSARIATREMRPSEVMAEHLARVAALNPPPTG